MIERRIGVIGVPGGWSTERFADVLAEKTGYRRVIDLQDVSVDLKSGQARAGDLDIRSLSALVVKKIGPDYSPELLDRLEMLNFLSTTGVRIFSKPESMLKLVNRLSCTVRLRAAGIPMPPTVITESLDDAESAVFTYGEAVLKPHYTSKARGMRLLSASAGRERVRGELEEFKALGNRLLYVQKKVSVPERDLGLAFLGGEYLGAYARVRAAGAWTTTTREGGHYASCEPRPEIISLAARSQALFGLDFTSVDIAETDEGPVVFEVSAFGGFRGLSVGAKIDAAGLYADYILEKLRP